MSGLDGKENCNKFVDILGLRTIFPLFMKTPKKNRRRILTTEEHEGMLNGILCTKSKLKAALQHKESYLGIMAVQQLVEKQCVSIAEILQQSKERL
jgi:hypothetical protein